MSESIRPSSPELFATAMANSEQSSAPAQCCFTIRDWILCCSATLTWIIGGVYVLRIRGLVCESENVGKIGVDKMGEREFLILVRVGKNET